MKIPSFCYYFLRKLQASMDLVFTDSIPRSNSSFSKDVVILLSTVPGAESFKYHFLIQILQLRITLSKNFLTGHESRSLKLFLIKISQPLKTETRKTDKAFFLS